MAIGFPCRNHKRSLRRRRRNGAGSRTDSTDTAGGNRCFPRICLHHSTNLSGIPSHPCIHPAAALAGGTSLSSGRCSRRTLCRSVGQKDSCGLASPGAWYPDSVGRVSIPLLESTAFAVLVGTLLGFLSGIGVGGGSLLILWLTLVLQVAQDTARSMNLMFFIPPALVACFFRWKQGVLNLKSILPAVICGCLAAGLFSYVGNKLDTNLLQKLFGGLLIATGIRELLYKPKKRHP